VREMESEKNWTEYTYRFLSLVRVMECGKPHNHIVAIVMCGLCPADSR